MLPQEIFFASTRTGRRAFAPVERETQNVLIEGELALQIRYREVDMPQPRRWGENWCCESLLRIIVLYHGLFLSFLATLVCYPVSPKTLLMKARLSSKIKVVKKVKPFIFAKHSELDTHQVTIFVDQRRQLNDVNHDMRWSLDVVV